MDRKTSDLNRALVDPLPEGPEPDEQIRGQSTGADQYAEQKQQGQREAGRRHADEVRVGAVSLAHREHHRRGILSGRQVCRLVQREGQVAGRYHSYHAVHAHVLLGLGFAGTGGDRTTLATTLVPRSAYGL